MARRIYKVYESGQQKLGDKVLTRVLETIKVKNMLKAGDKVVCALSGGADSMALLCVLYEIKDILGIEVYAAHLNHSIRGKDADDDYLFVKDFCEKKGVELFYRKTDIPSIAKATGKSEEEAGRIERYRFFHEVSESLGGARIATGHHMRDNAETVLFNLFRGSGAKGLGGIPFKRGLIIRPLLNLPKSEILNYLTKNGISWREDATNNECIYSRNRIRLVILKEIEKLFPDAERKITAAAENLKVDDDFISSVAELSGAFKDGAINTSVFNSLHEAVKRRVAINALTFWHAGDIDADKIKAVCSLAAGPTGKYRDVGGNVRIEKSYEKVKLVEKNLQPDFGEEYVIKKGENLEIKAFDGVWSIKTVDKTAKMRDNKMMIFLDADSLSENVSIRRRRDGDFISPYGMVGTKKLKKVFIDLKIPKEMRDRISMLTMGNEILFVPGVRKTKNYLPHENTKTILVAEYKRAD